jgi:hypothetical protein
MFETHFLRALIPVVFRPSCEVLRGRPNFFCPCKEKCCNDGQRVFAMLVGEAATHKIRKMKDEKKNAKNKKNKKNKNAKNTSRSPDNSHSVRVL